MAESLIIQNLIGSLAQIIFSVTAVRHYQVRTWQFIGGAYLQFINRNILSSSNMLLCVIGAIPHIQNNNALPAINYTLEICPLNIHYRVVRIRRRAIQTDDSVIIIYSEPTQYLGLLAAL